MTFASVPSVCACLQKSSELPTSAHLSTTTYQHNLQPNSAQLNFKLKQLSNTNQTTYSHQIHHVWPRVSSSLVFADRSPRWCHLRRKGLSEQAQEKVTPDSQKSTFEQAKEGVTGLGDRATGAIQPGLSP